MLVFELRSLLSSAFSIFPNERTAFGPHEFDGTLLQTPIFMPLI